MRKTKIICTLGPACDSDEAVRELMLSGMNVARLNFSHNTHEEQLERIKRVKRLRTELNLPVGIMLDTKGPEIRTKIFKDGSAALNEGDFVTVTGADVDGSKAVIPITYKNLGKYMKKGDKILIDDGLIELEAHTIADDEITCIVKNAGKVASRKSINLPGIHIDMPYMTEKDREDILFGIENDVDFIAASFVRDEHDIADIKKLLEENGRSDIKIIAKIENRDGVKNADKIISECYGLMVARGDLGVEVAFDELPRIQKELIKKCYAAGKIAITATQMLDSMIHNPRPTRAEVTDVANAVYDGTSAIMLSGETAAGKYPAESVRAMNRIALSTENGIHYTKRFLNQSVRNHTVTDAISHAACTTAIDLNAKAIVAVTQSGHTARMISKFRPACPIISATANFKVYNQLALSWGVIPVMNEAMKTTEELFESAVKKSLESGVVESGDTLVATGGSTIGVSGTTNILRVYNL